ncbi:Flp family type IVb pilin [Maricaulis sp. CAU 1757]
MSKLQEFLRHEGGATAIEYSFIAVVVSIAAIGALMVIGPLVADMLSQSGEAF